jgi:hypothetical protein
MFAQNMLACSKIFSDYVSISSDVDHYVTRKLLDFIFRVQWETNRHTKEIIEHRALFFCETAFSKYDVPSYIF